MAPLDAPGAMLAVGDDGDNNEPAEGLLLDRATSSGLLPAFPASGWKRPAMVGVLDPSFVRTSVTANRFRAPAATLALIESPKLPLGSVIRIADGARVTLSVPDPLAVVLAV